jgi:DNA-binding MarR family transcriptional regulator
MSSSSKTPRRIPTRKPDVPLIGSLLRLPREHIVARMLAEVHRHGFDVSQTELEVFMFPGPDGRRPADLARQCHMSRQAMNYVLTALERRGYVERRVGPTSASTVVHISEPGQEMLTVMRDCVSTVEREWIDHLGIQRFEALRETLRDLSVWLGKIG